MSISLVKKNVAANLVGNGATALVVDPRDQDALCQAMLDVLTDESLRRDLSHKGLERAKAFTWERSAEETVKACKAAVDERRP